MRRILSFEQAPQLSVPLRFFLTAPCFALAASITLFWYGPVALQSRWMPVTLALTHLLVLGFLTQTMIGALMQILPVVGGIDMPKGRSFPAGVHALLALGSAVLVAAFLALQPLLFKFAIALLAIGFSWFIAVGARRLWNAIDMDGTLMGIRMALFALIVAITIGMTLAGAMVWPLSLATVKLTNLHAMWGLLGWVGLLVMGVAFQVVPMFVVTPIYSRVLERWLCPFVLLILLVYGLAEIIGYDPAGIAGGIIHFSLAAGYMVFAVTTLTLLWRRTRPKMDVTTMFWWLGMASLLGCSIIWMIALAMPEVVSNTAYPLFLGILFIVGFGCSVMNGMLYKIVPFLVWYHLQSETSLRGLVPNVRQIVPEGAMKRQFTAHVAGLISLLTASMHPDLMARIAAVAFGISSLYLLVNLIRALQTYCLFKRRAFLQEAAQA